MGLTYVEGVVSSGDGPGETVRFLVDSGAIYTLLTEATWKRLGLEPMRSMQFTLADGSIVERGISECRLAIEGTGGHTPVVLGEPGDDLPLLGAVTLEERGLVLDPFSRQLRVMMARL